MYVLEEFRTLAHEPSAADMESDVSTLLVKWKCDHTALLARFDHNHDGAIDLDEWEQARLAARAGVEKNYREMQAGPELSVVRFAQELSVRARWIGISAALSLNAGQLFVE